jgi:hypothetical protein
VTGNTIKESLDFGIRLDSTNDTLVTANNVEQRGDNLVVRNETASTPGPSAAAGIRSPCRRLPAGIEAEGATDGGGNHATGNGDPARCGAVRCGAVRCGASLLLVTTA